MNSFLVFFQKEWVELFRAKKLYILIAVFAFFGMISPMSSRYMAEILALAANDMLTIQVPPTTWVDSWGQFYNNLSQMGGICVILLSMSSVVGEKRSGSAALTLTKNLSHAVFITAKFLSAAVCFLIALLLSVTLCYGYTLYLYGYAGEPAAILMGCAAYSLFTFVLLGVTVLASTAAQSTAVSAVLSFFGFIVLILSGYLPAIGRILPGSLLSKTVELSAGAQPSGMPGAVLVSVFVVALCLLLSAQILKRQEL